MIYRCQKCGYATKHKSHFGSHINKLYPCSNEVVNFTKEEWDKTNLSNTIVMNTSNTTNINSIDELNKLTKEELINIIKSLL